LREFNVAYDVDVEPLDFNEALTLHTLARKVSLNS
jgi:hypothetical protein